MNVTCHTVSASASNAPKAKAAYSPPKLESYTICTPATILYQSGTGTIDPLYPEE